jgi:hypothetical protein
MSYTSLEVSRLTGASLRQLQWWDEQGWISVEREGYKRVWDYPALRKAMVFAQIGKSGLSLLKSLARISDELFEHRFFLFKAVTGQNQNAIPKSLIAVTDDPAKVLNIAARADHGVKLIEVRL